MKICNHGEIIVDVQLDMHFVSQDDVLDDGNNIMLPYKEPTFLNSIRPLMHDVIRQTGASWQVPDYQKSQAYFYISGGEINLSIEVFPKDYSDDERQSMLSKESKETRNDGWSDYFDLLNMFEDIDKILNEIDGVGEIYVYHLYLENEEKQKLFNIFE